ncbi:hypothetical protein L249_0834 [Ophiocordyceps polyrhachis-furcata BCC 54312]|uniref:Uncharacterized protein n=1 Tax=Ophiocordyceps polyrhachis-furcata BCC 54312 TaxID=1330021 RepID=A0A367LDR5_9HYPO|nr:hypothetical protein L249_0834 [Ophiocordyceps polyrhachis-furcata BCC 54312]
MLGLLGQAPLRARALCYRTRAFALTSNPRLFLLQLVPAPFLSITPLPYSAPNSSPSPFPNTYL